MVGQGLYRQIQGDVVDWACFVFGAVNLMHCGCQGEERCARFRHSSLICVENLYVDEAEDGCLDREREETGAHTLLYNFGVPPSHAGGVYQYLLVHPQ